MKKLIEEITKISDEYFEKSQSLANIQLMKAEKWLEIKKMKDENGKNISNAEVEIRWLATEPGKQEAYLKIMLKALEKRRGAFIIEYRAELGTGFL